MCPSGGHGGGLREQLRRALGYWRNLEEKPRTLLVPAAALLLIVVYCFPLLSALLLCTAVSAWLYRSYPDWRPAAGGAAGRRQRPVVHRRLREPALKWTPSSLLLLMGSYLGKQEPPPRAVGRGARELKERLTRPNPAVATPARRLSFRETPAVSNRPYLSPRRRYPIHQPQYNMPGSLPTVYLDGFQRKALLSPKSSVRSPVTVKIARPDTNVVRSPVLDSLLSPGPVVQCAPDPCAKETVLNAIRESRKRMNKDDHRSSGGLDSKRRRHASSENEDMVCDHLPNGTVLSYVSRPDSLKRGLNPQVLEDQLSKRSRTSSISSLISSAVNGVAASTHNAITSSYSSSKDLQKRKRGLQNTSAVSSSPSSRSQTPDLSAKKAREESHETSPSTSVRSDRNHSGISNETPSKSPAVNASTENGSLDARRKKVLLVSGGRDQYPLPPPPLVGYSITSKDFDSEKKASLQRLNKALEDVSGPVPLVSASTTISTPPTSSLFSLPKSSPSSLSLPASSTVMASTAALDLPSSSNSNPLLLSLAKIQDKESAQASAQSLSLELKEKAPTSVSFACPETTKPSDNPIKLPSLSAPPAAEIVNGLPPAPKTRAAPEPPKPSLLFTKPLENVSQSGFNPVFPTSVAETPPASTGQSTATTFKPLFGGQNSQLTQNPSTFSTNIGSSTAQTPASTSPFTFQTVTAPSSATSRFSAFGAKSTNTTLSTVAASKPSTALPTSSSSTMNTMTSSLFPSATASIGLSSAPVNSLLGSNAPAEPSAKPFVFGPGPTSQTNSGLNMFSSAQPAPASVSQPQQPSLFGSNTSAFTATVASNPPSFPANSGTSAFNSTQGTGVKAEAPVQSSVTGFGSSLSAFGTGTQLTFGNTPQPTFSANSQPAFGTNATFTLGNSAPASKETFGNINSTQTNSTPAANVFGAKPFSFGGNTNSAPSFGTPNATPAQSLGFGNSLAQNSGIANPSTALTFGTPGPAENKPAFASQFGQSSPAVAPFATSTPAFGNTASFGGQPGGAFSIGVTPKPSGARQRVMARRQHQRKK